MSDTPPTRSLSSTAPAYPPPPWHLRGWSFQAISLVDLASVRPRLPQGLHVVPVGPRHTLGGVYVAEYGPGSTLEYHELILFAALVWRAGQIGCWVSHIYVDNPASRAGGRGVWNLPKELADFTVDEGARGRRIAVRQDGKPLITVEYRPGRLGLPLLTPYPIFGALDGAPRFSVGRALSRLGLAMPNVEIPSESPLADLGLGRPFLGIGSSDLDLLAAAPKRSTPLTTRRDSERHA